MKTNLRQFISPLLYFFVFFLISSAIILFLIIRQNSTKQLDTKISAIQKDVIIKNGSWDIKRYNTDPELIGSYPLYIFTTDGYVIDRRSPIAGYLDISDYHRLLTYDKVTTVATVANQKRRVLSKPIINNKKIIGVITVSYFNPQDALESTIDDKLQQTSNYISSKITVKNGTIDAKAVDVSKIDYDISFSIVDQYNTIIEKTKNVNNINKVPSYIDASYIKSLLQNSEEKLVQDTATKQIYLVKTSPIFDKNKTPSGVMAIGTLISPELTLLGNYVLFAFVIGVIGLIAVYVIFYKITLPSEAAHARTLQQVVFDERTGLLLINETKIKIPYATNQFYLLKALFAKPQKRWETDEILERFGEQITNYNWRIVYDTMIKINKKVSAVIPIKLILNQNKTYQLNPELFSSQQ